jgi:class 3 adenylate cyclase
MERTASFGEWVRRRRKALDLTQEQLARQVGCAAITIKKIEADERRPSRQIAERLAESLQLAPAERAAFVRAARGELATDRLDLPPPAQEAPPTLPSGTITFLFTDIEGSTRLWERHPQTMPGALARHDALVCQAIATHHGVVFKTTGDGVHAALESAPDALAAALAAQRALQTEAWAPPGPLRARMALHTGVAEERDGDYFGPALNRMARLLATGHGGQILVSRATHELVCDHLPPDVALRDLGVHYLKDLARPEHIFQLIAADLPTDFPPL